LVFALIAAAFAVSWPMTALMRSLGRRVGALDGPGVAGQVKAPVRRVPNTGGIAIFTAIGGLMALGLVVVNTGMADAFTGRIPGLGEHIAGMRAETPHAVILLGATLLLHVMGIVDDRRPLGPMLKLGIMLA